MKSFKIIIILLIAICFQSCHVGRFFKWNFADAKDHKKFDAIRIETDGGQPFQFKESNKENNFIKTPIKHKGKLISNFEEGLEKSGTVAFLVIRNDSILYENYFFKRDESSIHPSFSMAKSVVSMLIGIAIDEKKITSVNDPITNYIPELSKKEGFKNITIKDLLDMRSGISFNESYVNPFGNAAKYYYGLNIKKYITQLEVEEAPDKNFNYVSINTQLLALILENATQKNIAHYLQDKIWKPLNMEYDASWSIDSKKHQTVKAFCCLNARTKDFAKLGRLYLNKGNWNGKQIISEQWVKASTTFNEPKNLFQYSYQWWHNINFEKKTDSTKVKALFEEKVFKRKMGNTTKEETYIVSPQPDYFAEGILGQFIYVYPQKNIIIVRLGKKVGNVNWPGLFLQLAEAN